MTSVTEAANRLRRAAESGPIGKRHSSFELYGLLAHCMALAHRCRDNAAERTELEHLVLSHPAQGNRRFIEKSSDEYHLICRHVFTNGATRPGERSNASRYAHALREANRRQIDPDDLVETLKQGGGINALFLRRPLAARSLTTKCLRLEDAITVPKHESFTLTLRRTPENTFIVIRSSEEERDEEDAQALGG
jgi:hypothetical protein